MEPLDLVPCFVQAGSQLRRSREKTGMRVRDVEQASSRIASEVGNREFFLSNSYLSRLEKGRFVPSAAKMISLCKIYHLHLPELLSWFRMEAATSTSLQARTDARKTHLIGVEIDGPLQTVNFPIRLGAEFNRHQTMLLSRAVGQWANVPVGLVLSLMKISLHHCGYVGLKDHYLSPLMQPGAFFFFDGRQTKVENTGWKNDYDRAIYLIEHRQGLLCGWCALVDKTLTIIPHPLSECAPRHFKYPDEAEILGRIIWYCNPLPVTTATRPAGVKPDRSRPWKQTIGQLPADLEGQGSPLSPK